MPTSGTVGTTIFRTRKIIDLGYRRCKIPPQKVGAERIQTALDLLFLRLSALAAEGIPLWAVQKEILPLYFGTQSVPLPIGTVDLLNCNLRSLQRMTGTASASEGTAANAFDGDIATSTTQIAAGGFIQLLLESAMQATNFGILPSSTATWSITITGSNDGISFTTLYTDTAFAAVAGQWQWFDIEGLATYSYYRLNAVAPTVLNVAEFVVANMPQEIPCAQLNRDQYSNLPNKVFLGRPVQFWYDKQRTQPIITLWPSPGAEFTFYQLVCYVHRQIMDIGSMYQEVEVPQRWYMAVVARLAGDLAVTDEEVDPSLVATLDSIGEREWDKAWDGETDGASVQLHPVIRPYSA